jgi:hypothetical protein
MAVEHPMTYDELQNNYEFKIAKKMLIREYPWIKDVSVKPDEINKWNLIFLEVTIDPYELGRQEGWTVPSYVLRRIKEDGEYWSPYLSTYYSNASYEDTKPLTEQINNSLDSIHKSPALPTELRLPGTRKFQVGAWYTYPNLITPEDTTNSSD